MSVGLFVRAKRCQTHRDKEEQARQADENKMYREQKLRESAFVAELIRSVFGVDAEVEAHRYGNIYPTLGGVRLGPIWFQLFDGFYIKAVYACPMQCHLNENKMVLWQTFFTGGEDEVGALARLADLVDAGCTHCAYHVPAEESLKIDTPTSQGVIS